MNLRLRRTRSLRLLFISYRRSDSSGYAGWLYDHLATEIGRGQVYMDVVDIPPGSDYADRIRSAVVGSHAALIVIGPKWIGARDAGGERRLERRDDMVRLECQWAHEFTKTVIPVLVGNAALPSVDELPDTLSFLVDRVPTRLRDAFWTDDIRTLISRLGHETGEDDRRRATRRHRLVVASLALLVSVIALINSTLPTPGPTLGPTIAGVAPSGFERVVTPCYTIELPTSSVYQTGPDCDLTSDYGPTSTYPDGATATVYAPPSTAEDLSEAVSAYLRTTPFRLLRRENKDVDGRPAVALVLEVGNDPHDQVLLLFMDSADAGKSVTSPAVLYLSAVEFDSPSYERALQIIAASVQWRAPCADKSLQARCPR